MYINAKTLKSFETIHHRPWKYLRKLLSTVVTRIYNALGTWCSRVLAKATFWEAVKLRWLKFCAKTSRRAENHRPIKPISKPARAAATRCFVRFNWHALIQVCPRILTKALAIWEKSELLPAITMHIEDEDGAELKKWIVKKLENMYVEFEF